jgi:hypothetical protein
MRIEDLREDTPLVPGEIFGGKMHGDKMAEMSGINFPAVMSIGRDKQQAMRAKSVFPPFNVTEHLPLQKVDYLVPLMYVSLINRFIHHVMVVMKKVCLEQFIDIHNTPINSIPRILIIAMFFCDYRNVQVFRATV